MHQQSVLTCWCTNQPEPATPLPCGGGGRRRGAVLVFHLAAAHAAAPAPGSARTLVVDHLADRVLALGRRRVRVAVDGRTAAGKTTLGHELARRLADAGRVVLRASLDDFERPWAERHDDDRFSGEAYYRNAFDLDAIRRLLIDPAAPEGAGRVALCSIDPLTQSTTPRPSSTSPPTGCWWWTASSPSGPSSTTGGRRAVGAAGRGARRRPGGIGGGRGPPTRALPGRRRRLPRRGGPTREADVVIDNTDLTSPQLLAG